MKNEEAQKQYMTMMLSQNIGRSFYFQLLGVPGDFKGEVLTCFSDCVLIRTFQKTLRYIPYHALAWIEPSNPLI